VFTLHYLNSISIPPRTLVYPGTEGESFICNAILLYSYEVYTDNGFCQGCDDYRCSGS
jgi:hypothetical protein